MTKFLYLILGGISATLVSVGAWALEFQITNNSGRDQQISYIIDTTNSKSCADSNGNLLGDGKTTVHSNGSWSYTVPTSNILLHICIRTICSCSMPTWTITDPLVTTQNCSISVKSIDAPSGGWSGSIPGTVTGTTVNYCGN